jgi:hypothetical protein
MKGRGFQPRSQPIANSTADLAAKVASRKPQQVQLSGNRSRATND